MEHFDYLFAAYSIIFIVIFGYVAFIWRRQARLETELHAMEERLRQLKTDALPPEAKSAAQK